MLDLGTERHLPTVLLIDDDMVSREVIATVLTLSGYAVQTAADGAAALELLAAEKCVPKVMLVDAQMPGLSGTRLIAELRSRGKAAIVAISASKVPDDVVAACDGFLLKPFSPDALRKLLKETQANALPAAQSLETGRPAVNPETLAQLRAMMPEASVREIYAAIVTDLCKRLTALVAAISSGNRVEIRRIGHAIKGGCGLAGAEQAAGIGARLESGVDQLDNMDAVLADLRAATRDLKRMLEDEFPA